MKDTDQRLLESSCRRNTDHAQKMMRRRIAALEPDLYERSKRNIELLFGCWELVTSLCHWENAGLYRAELEKIMSRLEKKSVSDRVRVVLRTQSRHRQSA